MTIGRAAIATTGANNPKSAPPENRFPTKHRHALSYRMTATATLTPRDRRAILAAPPSLRRVLLYPRGMTSLTTWPRVTTPSPLVANSPRSEEHTSELQSLMRNSYAVFCLKKKKNKFINE